MRKRKVKEMLEIELKAIRDIKKQEQGNKMELAYCDGIETTILRIARNLNIKLEEAS